MAKPLGRPSDVGLGLQKSTGQYRKVIKSRAIYFGRDPDEALARYQFYNETGLVWKRGYHQFCLEKDGKVIPLGATIEIARRNFAARQARIVPQPQSVNPTEFVVNTVKEVGDAYLAWLIQNQKNPTHVSHTKQHFREMIALPDCGDLRLEHLTISYFKSWYNHCQAQVKSGLRRANWAKRRMQTIKAAFYRCRKEGWLGVAMPDLDSVLGVLQQHSGPQLEQSIFTPAELRTVIRSAESRDRPAILLGLNCAIGNADIGRLKWGDITERHKGGKAERIYEQPRGKTQRRRRTPLWPLTVRVIDEWRAFCKGRGMATGADDFIFTTRDGTPVMSAGVEVGTGQTWRHDAISARFAKLLSDLQMKRERLNWYSLRHTAATWATDYADEDSAVGEGNQFLLGQASDVMWKTYSKGVPPSVRKAVEAVWRGLNDGGPVEAD